MFQNVFFNVSWVVLTCFWEMWNPDTWIFDASDVGWFWEFRFLRSINRTPSTGLVLWQILGHQQITNWIYQVLLKIQKFIPSFKTNSTVRPVKKKHTVLEVGRRFCLIFFLLEIEIIMESGANLSFHKDVLVPPCRSSLNLFVITALWIAWSRWDEV